MTDLGLSRRLAAAFVESAVVETWHAASLRREDGGRRMEAFGKSPKPLKQAEEPWYSAFLPAAEQTAVLAHELAHEHESVESGDAVADYVGHKLTFGVGFLRNEEAVPKPAYLFVLFVDIAKKFVLARLYVGQCVVCPVVYSHFVGVLFGYLLSKMPVRNLISGRIMSGLRMAKMAMSSSKSMAATMAKAQAVPTAGAIQ